MRQLNLVNTQISDLKLGNNSVSEAYFGTTKIFPTGEVLPYKYWLGPNSSGTSKLKYSSNYGPSTLTISELNGVTENAAMSQNGQILFIAPTNTTSPGSYLRRSLDGGVTFSNSNIRNNFRSVVCSDNGQYVLTCMPAGFLGSYTAISSDYGATFTLKTNTQAAGVAISRNGQYMFYTSYVNGQYSRWSADYGATWHNTSSTFGNNNLRVKMSGNGQYVYMYQMASTIVYRSSDYGVTMNTINVGTNIIRSIAVSDDGQYVYIAPQDNTVPLMKSSTFGLSFSNTTIYGPGTVYGVNCSYDGKYVWLYVGTSTNVIISSDYGATWTTSTFGGYSVYSVMSR